MDYAQKKSHMQKGFTLIEILIAAALVMILGGIATASYRGIVESNSKSSTQASLKSIKFAIETYHDEIGEYPQSLQDLVRRPSDEKAAANWRPFIESKNNQAPRDAWKNAYVYNVTEGAENPFELYSYGSKKGKSTPKTGWLDAWNL